MTSTFTLEIKLETRNDLIEIDVECYAYIENDGIGPYEFWGQMYYDHGHEYFVIETTKWNKEGFTKEEINYIEKEIENNIPKWEEKMMENCNESFNDYL